MEDPNDDPVQYGLLGYQLDSDGVTSVSGSYLGVVLSVHPADSENNEWFKFLQGDISDVTKASYLEATVFLFFGTQETSIILPHCIIPQGKCSRGSSVSSVRADWTEDVPNGCTPEELDSFYDSSRPTQLERLSGDWVIVDFVGGLLQMSYISRWFPNPFNKEDAATQEDGARFLMRRNGTETKIDKNGDLFVSTRSGNYITSEGETFTIKNSKGQIFRMDSDGNSVLLDAFGNILLMDEDGISYSNGDTSLELKGPDLRVNSPSGNTTIVADHVNMFGNAITATGGGGGRPLTNDQLALDYKNLFAAFNAILEAIGTAISPAKLIIETFATVYDFQGIKLRNGITPATLTGLDEQTKASYLTKIFSAD